MSAPRSLTIGFDLDLTLINSRPGIEAVYRALADEAGVDVDLTRLVIGPPLEPELAKFFPPDQVGALADRYRALYPAVAVPLTIAMPGAVEAIASVREQGGRVVVITSKFQPNAMLHLQTLGLDVDEAHRVGVRRRQTRCVEEPQRVRLCRRLRDTICVRLGRLV